MDIDFNIKPQPVWNSKIFLTHTMAALLCWPLYWASPWIFGVAVSPYLVYLIVKGRQEYLLPLILHTWYGSQQRYIMLAACFLYALFHYRHLQRLGLHIIFTVYLLFLPFFMWYTGARIALFHSFVTGGVYEGISYYFSFAPLFWAAIVFRRLDKRFFWGLMIASFWVVFRGFLLKPTDDDGLLTGSTLFSYSRFHSWGSVYLFVVCVWAFLTKQSTKVKLISSCAALMFVLGFLHIGRSLIPFHLAGAAGLGAVVVFVGAITKKYPKLLHPCLFLIASTISVFWAVDQFEKRKLAFDHVKYSEISVRNVDDFILRLQNKLYGDRAPVWTAALNAVRQQTKKSWFFVDPNSVYGEIYRDDGLVVQVEIQAHNMFLEALRLYGICGGGGILLVLFLIAGLKRIRNCSVNINSPCAPVAAVAIGHIVFGYWGGQYLMIPAFSFTLYSLIGVCYRNQYEDDVLKKMRIANFAQRC